MTTASLLTGWLAIGLAAVVSFLVYVGANEILGGPHGIAWLVAPL